MFKRNTSTGYRLSKRSVQVTRQGWYFILLSLGVGLSALRTGNNNLFLALGTMLGTILVSGALASLNLSRIEVRRRLPNHLRSCTPFLAELTLHNTKRWLPSFAIEVEDMAQGRPLDRRCFFLKVSAGRSQSTSYRHAFWRRGRQSMTGTRISTCYPFGFIRRSRIIPNRQEVLILPNAVRTTARPKQGAMFEAAWTRARRSRRGDPYSLRPFRIGDDPSSIHHKASAHAGRPIVREFEDRSGRRVAIVLDNRLILKRSYLSAADEVEDAISRAAFLAEDLLRKGLQVSIIHRSGRVPFGAGPEQLGIILRHLALMSYADGTSPQPRLPQGVAIIQVELGWTQSQEGSLKPQQEAA